MWPRIWLSFIHGFSLSLLVRLLLLLFSFFLFLTLRPFINTPQSIYISYCLRSTLLFECVERVNDKKKYGLQCFTFSNRIQKINILRTNCKRFSIQLLRLAPRTTIYLFWIHTLPNGSNICFILFYCFFLPLWF